MTTISNTRAALCVGASLLVLAAPALAQTTAAAAAAADTGGAGLEEIIVSAQKRDESLQSVPISITAFSTKKLEQLNVQSFADYVKFIPSLSYTYAGPGFSKVYFRGVASGGDGNHSASLPSVGTYLDEQPVTTIQGALDIHIYDIARIEALAGPQGTLYGASSQAGTLRIITNKPELGKWRGGVDVSANTTAHGSAGYTAEGFINAPVADNAAVRLVGWYSRDGGYIDNVRATRTFPVSGITIDNKALVEDNFNKVDTYGGRAALKIDLDDNWTVTPQVMGQIQKSKGSFAVDPKLPGLSVARFAPENSNDRWLQAALTIEGKIGNVNLTYAGSYLKRKVDSNTDYNDYSFFYDVEYQYGNYITDNAGNLSNPSQRINAVDRYSKQSHEFRLATDATARLRAIGGVFLQIQNHNIEQNYIIDGIADRIKVTGTNNYWLTKQQRTDRDYAMFGEVSYDILDRLTLTAGARVYMFNNSLKGFFGLGPDGGGRGFALGGENTIYGQTQCVRPDPVVAGGPCTSFDKKTVGSGVTPKVNLTYKIDNVGLIYATYSKGFRPGGINRKGTLPPYAPDYLNNYEIGWKTSFADNRIRFNGAVFIEKWRDIQLAFVGTNGLTQIENVGNAKATGVESELTLAPIDGLTLSAAGTYVDAKLSNDYCKFSNPTFDCTINDPVTGKKNKVVAPAGQKLPITPAFKASGVARYQFPLGTLDTHLQASVTYQSSSYESLKTIDRDILGQLPGFALVDLSAGLAKNNWTAEVWVKNLLDERGNVSRFAQCSAEVCGSQTYVVITAPRRIGVSLGYRY